MFRPLINKQSSPKSSRYVQWSMFSFTFVKRDNVVAQWQFPTAGYQSWILSQPETRLPLPRLLLARQNSPLGISLSLLMRTAYLPSKCRVRLLAPFTLAFSSWTSSCIRSKSPFCLHFNRTNFSLTVTSKVILVIKHILHQKKPTLKTENAEHGDANRNYKRPGLKPPSFQIGYPIKSTS